MSLTPNEIQEKLLEQGVAAFGYSLIPKAALEDLRLRPVAKLLYIYLFSTLAEGEGRSVESGEICGALNISQKEYISGVEELLENGYLRKNERGSVIMASNPQHMSVENHRAAIERRKYWIDHPDSFLICDTEGTANRANELVEISMTDIDGNTLYSTLIKPKSEISHTGVRLHGITNEMVADAPSWEEVAPVVRKLLDERTMLAFDSISDVLRIKKTSSICGVNFGPIRHECIQKNVMLERNLKQAPPLYLSAGHESQNHRALDDCLLCVEIIHRLD